MNFNALLYYKNISNLCQAYDRKINEIDFSSIDEKTRLAVADKTLYLFCQATETYCSLVQSFNNSELANDTKQELAEALYLFKSKCDYLLSQMEALHGNSPDQFDPTEEFINIGKHIYRNAQFNIRELLEKEEEQHQKAMTLVRGYKNAIVNGVLMSRYNMVDVAAATHKLARSKILIDHCLSAATKLSNDKELIKTGDAIKKKVQERESARQVSTTLTPNGMLCSLYSHNLSLQDQRLIMDGATVESVLSKKDQCSKLSDYAHIFSLLTTDHTGLVYTQNQDKFGEVQVGKWLNKDDAKIAHLVSFKSQNQWDGSKQINNNDFINMVNATIRMWKNFKQEFSEIKDKLTVSPIKRKINDVLDSVFNQTTAEKIADIIVDPKSVKFALRTEDRWSIIQSETTIDQLIEMSSTQHLNELKSYLRRNATISMIKQGEDPYQWGATKRYASKAISSAADTLNFAQEIAKTQSVGLEGTLNMAGMLIDTIVPFDNFSNSSINENVERTVGYADKLLKMAVANEKWLKTRDAQYKDEIKEIGSNLSSTEAKQFVNDANFIKQMKIDALIVSREQDQTPQQIDR